MPSLRRSVNASVLSLCKKLGMKRKKDTKKIERFIRSRPGTAPSPTAIKKPMITKGIKRMKLGPRCRNKRMISFPPIF